MTANQKVHILIVDDNPSIHEDFKKILMVKSRTKKENSQLDELKKTLFKKGNEGTSAKLMNAAEYVIDSAYQGQDAYKMVADAATKELHYTIIFIDIRMPPGWDGLETAKNIWKISPLSEIVICTAYSDYSWNEIIETLGITDRLLLIKKPFEPIEIQQLALTLSTKWIVSQQLREHLGNLEKIISQRTNETRDGNAPNRDFQQLAALGIMAGEIAHELNTPLSGVFFAIQKMQREIEQGTTNFDLSIFKESLEKIQQSINYMEKISTGMVSLCQGTFVGKFEKIQVHQLIDDTTTLNASRLEKQKIRLTTTVEDDLELYCQPIQIVQVLYNILNNAIEAVSKLDEKWIEIDVKKNNEQIEFYITDSGKGVSKEISEQMTDDSFTGTNQTTQSGLGLHIARYIILNHLGTFTVNEKSKNTCFVISLPKTQLNRDQTNRA